MISPDKSSPSSRAGDASTQRLVRQLTRRYAFVLMAVGALVVVDQAVIQPLLVRMNTYAPVINTAGRQRMLSQKLSKAALALLAADDVEERRFRREELRTTLALWSAAHAALGSTDSRAGQVRIASPEIARELAALQPQFDTIHTAANSIIAQSPVAQSSRAGFASPDAAPRRAVRAVLDHESDYLVGMEHVVALLEQAAGNEMTRLRLAAVGIASAVIALLVALGWMVVRPATRTIRDQVDELESRVAHRTRELAEANRALRAEMVQREQAESKNQQLAIQLAHSARVSALGHLTVGLAHELNQPLGAIANYAEACDVLLEREAGKSGPIPRHLLQIKEAAARAGQIVRRMRNFVRPQQQSLVSSDLNSLVREVTELCRAEARRAHVRVSLDLTRSDALVEVDPIQIQQVLVNLAQNAFQTMQDRPRGERRLQIRTSAAEGCLLVEVGDSGPGISAEELSMIFTPFHTTKPDGLGIGLAIGRSIVERHGGEIWARSQPGQGATICFTLPCCSPNDVSHPRRLDSIYCR